jgi:cyclopropane-fatty-acyl-phospholipid synthase
MVSVQTEPARTGSTEAIQCHYDVGNDFYRLWLDPTLTYSCALWEQDVPDDMLEQAQRCKLELHVRNARARGAARVLDIGCGWGAMLRYLVKDAGVQQAVGLTLSRQQADAIQVVRQPGVKVRLENWTEHAPSQPYDAVISIGAFEHFANAAWPEDEAEKTYRAFFRRCHQYLKPGGWLSLQTIALGNLDRQKAKSSPEANFIQQEIFPEAALPGLEQISRASDGLFELVTLQNDREDYRRTCQVWLQRLTARRAEATVLVGEAVVKRYVRYLKLSGALFHLGQIGLLRIAFRRLDDPRW